MNDRDPRPGNLEETAVQIRLAYRLVAAYQRRLLDLVKRVEHQLSDRYPSLRFEGWGPSDWARPPSGNTDPAGRWTWDFIPLYRSEFGWTSATAPAPGAFWAWLWHRVDSGWRVSRAKEPDALTFDSADTCRTTIAPMVLAVPPSAALPTPLPTWSQLCEPVSASAAENDWIDGMLHEHATPTGVVRFGGFEVDLISLAEPEDVRANLVVPFLELIERARSL